MAGAFVSFARVVAATLGEQALISWEMKLKVRQPVASLMYADSAQSLAVVGGKEDEWNRRSRPTPCEHVTVARGRRSAVLD